MVAGVHVPVMGGVFVELPGRGGGALLTHSGPIGVNVGITGLRTVTRRLVGFAHSPAFGVKV